MISVASAFNFTFLPTSISSVPSLRKRNLPSKTISNVGFVIECSSRPQKKARKHHMKTRPRKAQPWDVKRKLTVCAPLPQLSPDWTLVLSGVTDNGEDVASVKSVTEVALAGSTLQAPASNG